MRKSTFIFILSFTVIFTLAARNSLSQSIEPELKDKRITIKLEKKPLRQVLLILIKNYDVPTGLEKSTLDKEHDDFDFDTNLREPKKRTIVKVNGQDPIVAESYVELVFNVKNHLITVNFENARLEDVLNKIVEQMENYKWEINDEVVNIFPSEGRDPKYEALLATKIKNYNFEKGGDVSDVRFLLSRLPEFKEFLKTNELLFDPRQSGFADVLDRKIPYDMQFSDLTFSELLNKITKIKRGGWILSNKNFSNDFREHIEIDI